LSDVGFDFILSTEPHGIFDTFDEVVDIPDVGVGPYLDNVSLAFSLI
jgi:hypothetical protein